MAAIGKLYTVPGVGQITVFKSTAAVARVELEEPVYKHYEDDEVPEFPAKFPCGRIAAFESAEGFNLTEGAAIARYSLSNRSTQHLLRVNSMGLAPPRPFFSLVPTLLTRLTLADIAVASVIFLSVSHTLDAPLHNMYPNVLRHLDLIIDQPKLKDVFGHPTFVEKAVQYTPPAKEKKEKEPKQPAPAPALKKEKPKKAEEDDEEDENPNPKIPLISHQNRRSISRAGNALIPTRTRASPVALECFCEKRFLNFYGVDFKYNEEVTIVFMSSNQISGFFKRLEASRKYLFGSVGITRAANDSITAGVLILRVKMSKPVVKIASNYERQGLSRGTLIWDLEIDNEKWQDGKNFKYRKEVGCSTEKLMPPMKDLPPT
ncbi:hypothetical protein EDD16DRAFT_1516795 [Pisolithus croceorrhizus]|nr:hypothetical protein EDD16DRAFT_1516795 [Pisolithus croceorrhizus]